MEKGILTADTVRNFADLLLEEPAVYDRWDARVAVKQVHLQSQVHPFQKKN